MVPTELSYFQERMQLLGITEEINCVNLLQYNAETQQNEQVRTEIFRETEKGIDILVYTLNRTKIPYAKEGSRWRNKDYCITRLKEPRVKKDGSIQKYDMPKGQPTRPFFPPALLDKYEQNTRIPVLYITEGYFKAFKAQMHGIDCVGLPSITCMREKDSGLLHEDIRNLIIHCQVERVVWLTDGDCRNITSKEITDESDLYRRPRQFFQTVSTFYDLLGKFDDVQKYFAHVYSDNIDSKPKGLDDLLCALPAEVDDIRAEAQDFAKVRPAPSAGQYFVRMNISFGIGHVHKYFLLHDVNSFYLHHVEQRPELRGKKFKFNGTLYTYNEQEGVCTIEVPRDASNYFRVGDKYFEFIDIPNKYNELTKTFHKREKETIKDDNGREIFKHIPKYKSFCVVPDHLNYQRVIHNCFNMYHPFEHEVDEGDFDASLRFVKHIFGEEEISYTDKKGTVSTFKRWEMGLDYLTLLYKKPQQILPILCLVSSERQTGKTTFAKWLRQIFGENMAIVGNEDLASPFNSHWASKLIVCCDETKIDKHVVIEKVKSLSTGDKIMMNAKGRDQVELDFFGKFIFLSNNEENFLTIDDAEIRFWILKVPTFSGDIQTNLIEELNEEIPAFLNFLYTRNMVTTERERHWFDSRLLKTEALQKVVANSRPNIEKQLALVIAEIFEYCDDVDVLTISLEGITNDLLKKRWDKDYVKRTLHKMGYKTQAAGRRSYPRLMEVTEMGQVHVKSMPVNFHARYYEFYRYQFITEQAGLMPIAAAAALSDDLPF